MHEMNEFERLVAGELRRDAGPVLPVDDLAVYESVAAKGRPRWSASFLRFASYLVAGAIVALFGGFLLVGVVTQPPGDGIPAAPGGSASPEGTPFVSPTPAPDTEERAQLGPSQEPKENDMINLRTPVATALAVGLLATPAATAAAEAELMEPARVTGTSTFAVDVASGTRAYIDGAMRGQDRIVSQVWEASDPRLDGEHTTTYSYHHWEGKEMMVALGEVVHENEGGRWTGEASYMGGLDLGGTTTMVMHGEGAYEGLTAYVVVDEEAGPISFSAVVFPGEMPPFEEAD